jgi:hypothetical protein
MIRRVGFFDRYRGSRDGIRESIPSPLRRRSLSACAGMVMTGEKVSILILYQRIYLTHMGGTDPSGDIAAKSRRRCGFTYMPPEVFPLDPAGDLGYGACTSGSNAVNDCISGVTATNGCDTGSTAKFTCQNGNTPYCQNLDCSNGASDDYYCVGGLNIKTTQTQKCCKTGSNYS